MKTERGSAQVVFSFLPQQTADLKGRVWRVAHWSEARTLHVDPQVVRAELLRASYPWAASGRDGGFGDSLRTGRPLDVVAPNPDGGVAVEPFPENYRCAKCGLIENTGSGSCKGCGEDRWQQLPFVAFHECGYSDKPWIPKCKAHQKVALEALGRSSSTATLRFYCPTCKDTLSRGFPHVPCPCGQGTVKYNVHRAASVYTPRSTVVLNPPTQEVASRLRAPGAEDQILDWVLQDMKADDPLDGKTSRDGLVAKLVESGLSPELAEQLAAQAAEKEGAALASDDVALPDMTAEQRESARDAALHMAYAVSGGRTRVSGMLEAATGARIDLYGEGYRRAFDAAGLVEVELLEDFLVLDTSYGYTRDGGGPGDTTLRSFGDGNGIRVHGQLNHTEALLFRLDPQRVAAWLAANGVDDDLGSLTNAEVRGRVLAEARVPRAGEVLDAPTYGSSVLRLVHSYAHRVLRRASAFCGIDRDALSEYLVPEHLAFVVFASSRGDFTLGGLQAVFEQDLHRLLDDVVGGERRCALDPTCTKHGSACVACLHVGEPSCRCFNQHLSRDALFGSTGFFDLPRLESPNAAAHDTVVA